MGKRGFDGMGWRRDWMGLHWMGWDWILGLGFDGMGWRWGGSMIWFGFGFGIGGWRLEVGKGDR